MESNARGTMPLSDGERASWLGALPPLERMRQLANDVYERLDEIDPEVRRTSLVIQLLEIRLKRAPACRDILALRTHPALQSFPSLVTALQDNDDDFLARSAAFRARLAG